MSRIDIVPTWIDEATSLEALVLVSLFSDRRADADDDVGAPVGQIPDRRGWWADATRDDGDLVGSRLWLLMGEPLSDELAETATEYCREALEWMIVDGLLSAVDVASELERGRDQLSLQIDYLRPDGTSGQIRFDSLWEALE